MKRAHKSVLSLAVAGLLSGTALADDVDTRHGSVSNVPEGMVIEAGVVATYQVADDSRAHNEAAGSADLVITLPVGPGTLLTYIEGSSTPQSNGVASLIGEANGDSGSALDKHGHGRFQISEFHYTLPLAGGDFTIGLMDTTGFLDGSDVANDQNSQFLSGSFVNNPTIEFPDYVLGGAYHRDGGEGGMGFSLVLSSSHGLADNNGYYDDTFDVGDNGKGVFAAAETQLGVGDANVALGIWTNTADHAELAGPGTSENNWGLYAVVDGQVGETAWNVRAGWADESVSTAANFLSVAMETPVGPAALGAALGRTGVSDDAGAGTDDTWQAEIYARFEPFKNFQISPDLQWIRNTGFDNTGTSVDEDVIVAGVRAAYSF